MWFESIFLGLIIAFIGYIFQQRAWNHRKREEIRQREFDATTAIVSNLSIEIDKRLFSMTRFLSKIKSQNVSDNDVEEYAASVRDWMHNFLSFKSQIFHFFGKEKMFDFEYKIQKSLQSTSDILLRSHKLGLNNLSRSHRKEHQNLDSYIRKTRYEASIFIQDLNQMISEENIGKTSLYNNIQLRKVDYISRLYLIQRLFGVKE